MLRSGSGNFDRLLDKATSHLLLEPDWPSILQISDLIRQNDVQPRYAFAGLKKKMQSANPHTAMYALLVLESMVKNCGGVIHEELTTKAFCDFLHELTKTTAHENVRQKVLELIQAWNFALRKNPKHQALKDLVSQMKAEGYKFPALHESDAMFSADTAPAWVDGDVCHRCRVPFTLVQRKHHCRACGQVFCGQCSSKQTTLPKFGFEKEVRVCDACFDEVTKPSKPSQSKEKETDLPPEYLKSPLAQQSQEPPRKSEEELREEEELQLALALSQSEAEAKEKEKFKATNSILTSYKAPEPVNRSPSPEPQLNPELEKYLNRSYWESRQSDVADTKENVRVSSPSAPATAPIQVIEEKTIKQENGMQNADMEEFIKTLKSQVEIFINRMKSNSSRGRSIANDSSVQTLFLNITAMHSKLLHYIQQHDDSRLYYERLQDKLTQVKDARAALDALRDEHRDKLRREAEESERQRQLQMAHKLEIMRKKKQEYLQYQRQLALQRIQEQEREMQMRQEQQKQQYMMGPQYGYIGSPAHAQQYPPNSAPSQPIGAFYQYTGQMGMPPQQQGHPMHHNPQMAQLPASFPNQQNPGGNPNIGPGPQFMPMPPQTPGMPQQHGRVHPQQGPLPPQHGPLPPQQGGIPPQHGGMPPQGGMPQQHGGMPQHGSMHQQQGGMPQQQGGMPQQQGGMPQQQGGMPQQQGGMPQQQGGMPQQQGGMPQQQGGMPPQHGGMPQQAGGMPPQQGGMQPQQGGVPPQQGGVPQQFPQAGAPPQSPQAQQNGDAQTAELISFD